VEFGENNGRRPGKETPGGRNLSITVPVIENDPRRERRRRETWNN
jgi:hypothetical protein